MRCHETGFIHQRDDLEWNAGLLPNAVIEGLATDIGLGAGVEQRYRIACNQVGVGWPNWKGRGQAENVNVVRNWHRQGAHRRTLIRRNTSVCGSGEQSRSKLVLPFARSATVMQTGLGLKSCG
jgi:hypothetical protein